MCARSNKSNNVWINSANTIAFKLFLLCFWNFSLLDITRRFMLMPIVGCKLLPTLIVHWYTCACVCVWVCVCVCDVSTHRKCLVLSFIAAQLSLDIVSRTRRIYFRKLNKSFNSEFTVGYTVRYTADEVRKTQLPKRHHDDNNDEDNNTNVNDINNYNPSSQILRHK